MARSRILSSKGIKALLSPVLLTAVLASPRGQADVHENISSLIETPSFDNMPLTLPTHPDWHVIREGFRIRMYAPTCDELTKMTTTLNLWRTRHGESAQALPSTQLSMNHCTADITNLLPSFGAKILHQHPLHGGPSSWNLALHESKLVSTLRHSDADEFRYYMKSEACRRLNSGEPPQIGDIGRIQERVEGRLVERHAFVYLNEHMIFAKDDSRPVTPFSLQQPAYLLEALGFDRTPARCSDLDATNDNGCTKELAYYRCQSLESFTKALSWVPTEEMKAAFEQTRRLEQQVSDYVFGVKRINSSELDIILKEHDRLFGIYNAISQRAVALGPDEEVWFYVSTLRTSLVALAYQITGLNVEYKLASPVRVRYRHEPWQAAQLDPATPAPKGPVRSWANCRAGGSPVCPTPEGTSAAGSILGGTFLGH